MKTGGKKKGGRGKDADIPEGTLCIWVDHSRSKELTKFGSRESKVGGEKKTRLVVAFNLGLGIHSSPSSFESEESGGVGVKYLRGEGRGKGKVKDQKGE